MMVKLPLNILILFLIDQIVWFTHLSSLLVSTNDHVQSRQQNRKYFLQAWHYRSKHLLTITSDGVSRSNVSWLDNHEIRPIVVGDPRVYEKWYNKHLHGEHINLHVPLALDPIFIEMQTKCVLPETMESRIAFPIELYMSETPFRIRFFEKMKSLVHLKFETFPKFDEYMTVTMHGNKSQNVTLNLIDFAWSFIVAIKVIRTCNISHTLPNNVQRFSSIENVPLQHFHGAAYTDHSYFRQDSDDDNSNYKNDSFQISFQQLLVDYLDPDVWVEQDPFQYVFRAIWIHSKNIDFSLLQYTTNFNSWSTALTGALDVAVHFLKYEALPSWSYDKLIILVAQTNWDFVQSIRKWYSNTDFAAREREVVTPPFMKYIIDADEIQLPANTFRYYLKPVQEKYVQFLNKNLADENILILKTEMIEFTWDTWFDHVNENSTS